MDSVHPLYAMIVIMLTVAGANAAFTLGNSVLSLAVLWCLGRIVHVRVFLAASASSSRITAVMQTLQQSMVTACPDPGPACSSSAAHCLSSTVPQLGRAARWSDGACSWCSTNHRPAAGWRQRASSAPGRQRTCAAPRSAPSPSPPGCAILTESFWASIPASWLSGRARV